MKDEPPPTPPSPPRKYILHSVLGHNAYRFALSGTAGLASAAIFYPADLLRSLTQNQREYKNAGSLKLHSERDLFKMILSNKGVRGLYAGLTPYLIISGLVQGVKLTVNDMFKDQQKRANHQRLLKDEFWPAVASGVSQVIVKNPLEVVKIRMQTRSPAQHPTRMSSMLRSMNVRELYKASLPSMIRDVQFLVVFFTAFAVLKNWFADEKGHVTNKQMFASAFIAGIPASGLCTPFDVIKTRLQVLPMPGQTVYHGMWDAFRKIHHEEGNAAFWRGTFMRIFRVSPQIGLTVGLYELLQRCFNVELVK